MTSPSIEKAVFQAAILLADATQRSDYLDAACQGDSVLRARIEDLLAAAEDEGFMKNRAVDSLAESKPRPKLNAPFDDDDEVAQRIDNYKLLQKIGEGGFGVVYMAEQQQPVVRRVALKIIKPGMDTKQVIARFEAERQAIALMEHPNIAQVFDAGETENGRPYFVMELVRGVPVIEFCDQQKLNNMRRLELFRDICGAVQHAHQKGIIHRDLKPSNILVTMQNGEPVPKVIDFGIAKATQQRLTDKTLFTRFEQFVGTPAYMSPEQVQMSSLDVDTRSDIYSLGVLLYELLTGTTPLDAKKALRVGFEEFCRCVRDEEFPQPSQRVSSLEVEERTRLASIRGLPADVFQARLRGDLDWIVMKAVDKDRRRRYDTASAFSEDVQRFLQQEPVTAVPPSTIYRLRKFIRRNRTAVLMAAAITAALMIGMAVATVGMLRAVAARKMTEIAKHDLAMQVSQKQTALNEAKTATERAQAAENAALRTAYLADMQAAHQSLQLNNLGLAQRILDRNRTFDPAFDPRHWEWRALWLQCRGNTEKTFDDPGGAPLLSVSPDETWIAAGGGGVRLWNTRTEEMQTLIEGGESCHVVFSPNGENLYVGDSTGTVRSWRLPDFAPSQRTMAHGARFDDVDISPDGKWLAALGADGDATVWELATGNLKKRIIAGGGGELAMSNSMLAIGLHNTIRVFDLPTLTERSAFGDDPGMDGAAIWGGDLALEFSPDGRFIASASGVPFLIRRVSDGGLVARLNGHTLAVRDLAYSPDGKLIASASSDQTIILWNTETHEPVARLRRHELDVWKVKFSADGRRLYSGGKDGRICVWNIADVGQTGWPIRKSRACGGGYYDKSWVSFSPDGGLLATTKHWTDKPNCGFFLRSTRNLEVVTTLSETGAPKTGVRYSPVENLVVAGSWDGSMEFIDLDDSGHIDRVVVAKEQKKIFPMRFTPDGERLLVVGRKELADDILCAVYSVRDRKEIVSWSFPPEESRWARVTATISPDGELVATGHGDGVRFWSVNNPVNPTHVPMRKFRGLGGDVGCLDFSPDGKYLIAGAGLLSIIDMHTMRVIDTLVGHMQHVMAVRFSPDGKRVASAGSGKPDALKLWDFETRREIMTLMVDGVDNRQIEWSPDGNAILMMGGNDSTLSMWRVPSFEEIQKREKDADQWCRRCLEEIGTRPDR